jgi:hypothetical protein
VASRHVDDEEDDSIAFVGTVRWMEVRDWLKRETENGTKPVRQIEFQGER